MQPAPPLASLPIVARSTNIRAAIVAALEPNFHPSPPLKGVREQKDVSLA